MNYTYDADNFKRIFEGSFTWIAGFMRNVRRYPNKNAMIDFMTDDKWTYSSLNKEANKLANRFVESGLSKGDVVFYQLYNSPQFVFSYIAPQKIDAINFPGNFNISAQETANIIDRDKPKVYIYDCDICETAWKALELAEYKPQSIVAVNYRKEEIELPDGHVFYEDYVSGQSEEDPILGYELDMYSEVTRLCTSGTTGTPKRVPLNNVNEVLSAHDVIMHFPLSPLDITMNMTPWFHRGGLHSGGPCPTLFAGACLVVLRMFSAKACFEAVEKYGITYLIGVPSALRNIASRQEKNPADISTLKGIVTMGSPLEKDECVKFQKLLTPNIFNGYGTTETFWNSFLRPYDLPDEAGSAGGSCTGDDVRVVKIYEDKKADPDELVPTDGESAGEIIIYSPEKSALCYINDEEQTQEKFKDGWYYTKDIGTWNEKKYISVTGRKDNMIICMGENIYPEQVEEEMKKFDRIKDVMIVGVKDLSRGQAVTAYIIPADDELTVKDINKFCTESDSIAKYMVPRFYKIVDELPYTLTGKKQHSELRKIAEKDAAEGNLKRP